MATYDVLDVLRNGYTDTFSELDDDDACYNFLQPHWIGDENVARQSAHIIGNHGDFDADCVASMVTEVFEIDPICRFVFGRENWPVVYILTSEVEPVMQALEDAYPSAHTVINNDDPIGWYKDEDEIHGACPHDEGDAPILAAEWPARKEDLNDVAYIRALWQDG